MSSPLLMLYAVTFAGMSNSYVLCCVHLEGSFLLTTVLVIARGIRYSIVEDSFVCGGSPVPLNVLNVLNVLLVTCVLERTIKCVSVGC